MRADLSAPLRSALEAIALFERGEVDVEGLQVAIRTAEDSVTEYELLGLRRLLQAAEGKLELIRFTLENDYAVAEALKVAHAVRDRIRDEFGESD